MTQEQEKLSRLIHLSGRLLDEEDFDHYAALFAEDGEYRLETKAPQVAQPMTWVWLNRQELGDLLASAPKHVWNTGQRSHLISVEEVNVDGDSAHSWAAFSVFRTDDEGVTQLYAVGRYEDRWQKAQDDWRLLKRVTRLRTRVLAPSSAIPV
jgi:3-phenylpropionate/cinnamic acid dioxygenase small subunit